MVKRNERSNVVMVAVAAAAPVIVLLVYKQF